MKGGVEQKKWTGEKIEEVVNYLYKEIINGKK